MAEALDWVIVVFAGSSLIFALVAFRQVMKSSKSVDGFLQRADKLLNNFSQKAKGIFTPAFMGDMLVHSITKGLKNPDGTQVSMAQYINGYAVTFGPAIYQDLKKEIPSYIPLLLNQNPSPQGPQGSPNKGSQLAEARWGGSGGLKAATNVAKAAKKLPFGQKIAEYVEGAQALVQLGGTIRELKNEIVGMKGGGGNGEDSTPSTGSDGAMTDWGPPF